MPQTLSLAKVSSKLENVKSTKNGISKGNKDWARAKSGAKADTAGATDVAASVAGKKIAKAKMMKAAWRVKS